MPTAQVIGVARLQKNRDAQHCTPWPARRPRGTFPLRYSHHGPPADPGGTFPLRYLHHGPPADAAGTFPLRSTVHAQLPSSLTAPEL